MPDVTQQEIEARLIANAPEPVKQLGSRLADILDADHWNNIEPLLLEIAALLAAAQCRDARHVLPACDCGATSEGKWAGIHARDCASQKSTQPIEELIRYHCRAVEGWPVTIDGIEDAAQAIAEHFAAQCRAPGETWQPIETAPHDRTGVLTFTPSRKPAIAVMWLAGGKWVTEDGNWYVKGPTHWRPLPSPPKDR